MKVLILGAGQVGSSVATHLSREDTDITIVDHDEALLSELQDHIDIKTVIGEASDPDVLEIAGARDADILLAVTNSDETNMVACQVAHTIFNVPTKIARVRSNSYLKHRELFSNDASPVDVLISPEQEVTRYIARLIEHPGALQVLDFADGAVQLVAIRVSKGGPLVGRKISEIKEIISGVDARVAAIYRSNVDIVPVADTIIEIDDEVFFIAAKGDILTMMKGLRRLDKPYKRIIIGGGGNIGQTLAQVLEKNYRVKVIERDRERAKVISTVLKKSIVLHGDVSDADMLIEEDIESTDVYCAVTNNDAANILAAMLAKRMGVRKVIALVNKASFIELVESTDVDIAVSPQQATIGTLLKYVRLGDVPVVHSLRRGAAEAIEAVAHGDSKTSKLVGRTIGAIKLPPGTTIGAIVRNDEVFMGHHDIVIQDEDHIILFVIDRSYIHEVESLFQPVRRLF